MPTNPPKPFDISNLSTLAKRATKVTGSIPITATSQNNYAPAEANFLSALQNLPSNISSAPTSSDAEARAHLDSQFANIDAAANNLIVYQINNGGGSPSSVCQNEMEQCTKRCDSDPSAGYTCYLNCRITFYACLAGTIVHGAGGIARGAQAPSIPSRQAEQ
jgi:hypothetical protein